MARKIYQWERFWCPAGGSYSLDNNGFLVDPKSEWGKYYKDSTILTFDEIPTASCLALLGEPGIGKTKALEEAYRLFSITTEAQSLSIDLRIFTTDIGLLSSIESNQSIKDWITGDYKLSLFLDSLDEGALNLKTIAAVLIDLIKRWPRKRLEIKFACRTADWPKLLDTELCFLFNLEEIPKYELLPLRQVDVENAASLEGIDPLLFIKAVKDAELTAFANRPITLNFLLSSYKLDGQLSEQKSEVYRKGCIHLCTERNESRLAAGQTGKLSPAQRIMIAARIAAAMMFSNKYTVWTDVEDNFADEDLSILSLSGFSETIYGGECFVDEHAIKETLGTGLFNSRGESRIGFAHQTYLEYLAAYYLIKKQVPLEKILTLIKHSDGKIIPQLQEVAIWLATLSENVFAALFDIQPDILLHVPKDALTNKKKILTKLLSHCQSGALIDNYQLLKYFNRLEYVGMAHQLRPYLVNKKLKLETRRVAILIARECRVVELADTLVSIALNPIENQGIREHAGYAVCNLGDQDAQMALLPLALGDIGEDPQDELKGIGLKAVWGKLNNIESLLERVTPVRNENLIGTYYHFFSYEFAELIRVEHLAQVLDWLLQRTTNLGNEILEEDMIHSVMLRAWNHLDYPNILVSFAQLAYKRLLGHQENRSSNRDNVYTNDLGANPLKRRMLVSQIVVLMKSSQEAFYLAYHPPFLFPDDIDWIVANIEQTDDESKRGIWTQLLFYLVDISNQDALSKAYEVYVKYAEIKAIFSNLFEPIDLNSQLAKTLRDYENQSKAIERAKEEKSINPINHRSQLLLYIDQFSHGDIDAWWKLNLLVLGSDPNKGGHEFEMDLASFALWESVDSQIKESLISMARQYLDQHSGGEIYLDDNRIYRPAVSGFRALYLIARMRPEILDNLPVATWSKWASVILTFPAFSNLETLATHQIIISRLLKYSEVQFYDLLRRQIDREEASQYLQVLALLAHLDTQELQRRLVEVLELKSLTPIPFGQILQFLLERNNLRAKQISLETVRLKTYGEESLIQKKFQAARSLMLYSDDGGWPTIDEEIRLDQNFGEKLFLGLAFDRHNLAGGLVRKLSESEVARLYMWLESKFPEDEDPSVPGMHAVTERENVGQVRDSLIVALAGKGSEQACTNLRQLKTKYPQNGNLPYYLEQCEEKMRRKDWVPYKVYSILEIARNAYRRDRNSQRRRENVVYAIIGFLANIFIIILPGVLANDKNGFLSFLVLHQGYAILILILSTFAVIYINSTRIVELESSS